MYTGKWVKISIKVYEVFKLEISSNLSIEDLKSKLHDNEDRECKAHIDDLIEFLGLTDRQKHLPNQLLGGQQQRVAIARALAAKPAIILADEPTGNLDTKTTVEVLNLLKESIKKYNQILIMITHNEQVAKNADRIISIVDGQIVRSSLAL